MDQANHTVASFTGTLLKREHKLGQKFVQLIFRENDKNVLCVSMNPKMATLAVGQKYFVEGEFKKRGDHAFVYDPAISLIKKHWRPIHRILAAGIGVTCLATIGGVAYMQSLPPAKNVQHTKDAAASIVIAPPASTTQTTTSTTTQDPPTTTPSAASTPAAVTKTVAKTTATKPTITSSSSTSSAPTSTLSSTSSSSSTTPSEPTTSGSSIGSGLGGNGTTGSLIGSGLGGSGTQGSKTGSVTNP